MINFSKPFSRENIDKFYNHFLPEDTVFKRTKINELQQDEIFSEVCLIGKSKSLNNLHIFEIRKKKRNNGKLIVTKNIFSLLKKINVNYALIITYTNTEQSYKISLVNSEVIWLDDNKVKRIYSDLKRKSFMVGPNERIYTPKLQLITKGRVQNTNDLDLRFDLEVVTDEFFTKYKELYENIALHLEDDVDFCNFAKKNKIEIKIFAKNILGQIVFCYFLQKMNFLGAQKSQKINEGPNNFLRENFDKISFLNENFYNDFIEYLFYKGLNEDNHKNNNFVDKLGFKVPFLNGGLFEPPVNYDWEKDFLKIPNEIFSNKDQSGILDVFDLFNFTVDEFAQNDTDLAVDPEMLGKVFENLIEENIKKEHGTYYTHRDVVKYMCVIALTNYLLNKLKIKKDLISQLISYSNEYFLYKEINKDNSSFEKIIKNYAENIDEELKYIKICDPAIGSGAFPVAFMQLVVSIRFYLKKILNQPASLYELKFNFIKYSLHGVDVDQSAIEIAKLRLWLSLIVESKNLSSINTLPNLQYRIVQGDSLIDNVDGYEVKNDIFDDEQYDFTFDDKNINELFHDLISLQNKFYDAIYKNNKNKLLKDLKNKLIEIFTLFVSRHNLKNQRVVIEKFRSSLKTNIFDNFFPWRLFYANTFSLKGGFDIIIGNPPYLESRHSEFKLHKKLEYINNLENKFPEKIISKGSDLLTYFFPLAYWLMNENGVNVYITQNAWLATNYGSKLQDFLKSHYSELKIIDSNQKYFSGSKGPNINTIISLANKKDVFKKCQLEFTKINHKGDNDDGAVEGIRYFDEDQLDKYKWGVLFDSDDWILDIFRKFTINTQKRYSLGQGLNNVTPNKLITKEFVETNNISKKNLYPFLNKIKPYYDSENYDHFITTNNKIDRKTSEILKNNEISVTDISERRLNSIPSLFMARGIDNKFFTSVNSQNCFTSSAVEIYINNNIADYEIHLMNLWAFCNSSIFFLLREISGRKNLGGGMLKAEKIDIENINLLYEFDENKVITEIFRELKNFEISSIDELVNEDFHLQLNKIVARFFGFDDKINLINECLVEKVSRRRERSTT